MPTVNVDVKTLYEQMGKELSNLKLMIGNSEFEDLCFEFGIELEDITSTHELSGKKEGEDRKIFRIDIPANRYDMLCVEGIARALAVYLGLKKPAEFKISTPATVQKLIVKKETAEVRPFVVAAILRDIKFDQLRYDGFIELQDKLHNNICRYNQVNFLKAYFGGNWNS
jgi:phenylalanyl-tRNA synthetase beta chain